MEYIIKFCYKTSKVSQLLVLLLTFFLHGYSTPLDTIKKPNCPNGYLISVNGNLRCIDTTLNYYPVRTEEWDETDTLSFMEKSINLQFLDEPKWCGEDIQGDRFRIFLIDSDSIILYSIFNYNQQNFKLIKKEMLTVDYTIHCYDIIDTVYFDTIYIYYLDVKCSYIFPKEIQSVNYKKTEFTIHKKEMKKLLKQLDRLKNCETFNRYGDFQSFVIEYFMNGNYFLLVAKDPKEWGRALPEFAHLEKNCRRKDGLKIMKWLSRY